MRKEVKEFSENSRRRMLAMVNSMIFEKALFVTLTYHENVTSSEVAKDDLYATRKAVERRYGKHTVIWRIERQERGACHFHMMILEPSEDIARTLETWLPVTWDRIAGKGVKDDNHVRYGTRIDKVGRFTKDDRGAVIAYLAKYTSKQGDAEGLGRAWGCWNKDIRQAKQLTFDIAGPDAVSACGRLLRAGGYRFSNPSSSGVTLFLGKMGEDSAQGDAGEFARDLAQSCKKWYPERAVSETDETQPELCERV